MDEKEHVLADNSRQMSSQFTFTNFSEGAKHPTQRDIRIQPLAWLLLDGFWVSCLQIWQ